MSIKKSALSPCAACREYTVGAVGSRDRGTGRGWSSQGPVCPSVGAEMMTRAEYKWIQGELVPRLVTKTTEREELNRNVTLRVLPYF